MVEPIPFEPDRFRSAAGHYLRGRPGYAPRLIALVVARLGLGRQDRVIDLGCGPGVLAAAFAPEVAEVVGIDPSADMLAVARATVPENVRLLQASSYDLSPALGPAALVAMGRSFHWMDRADTLRRLDAVVTQGGAVALFGDTHPDLPENAWTREYSALLGRWSDDDVVRQGRRSGGWVRHEAFLLDSAFSALEGISVIERRRIAAETLVDRALSMSSTSRARLGAQAEELLAELRGWLAGVSLAGVAPDGWLSEVVATNALMGFRS